MKDFTFCVSKRGTVCKTKQDWNIESIEDADAVFNSGTSESKEHPLNIELKLDTHLVLN